ncbi:uncharacterized protein LOC110243419 [Exaiptasia diaphana]|uniref:Uncharacterized protein n=1 Tax=Exaiptasia diaphana TaxID=2652724 RepID=A0A913XJD1_EXADI|nr:uncharacterized protein LOC110243419 [Exaiptasia diaphana]KXJ25828.1 hypothetical protein AC249_AIPGENE27655 [Exaiptasia diaphana]
MTERPISRRNKHGFLSDISTSQDEGFIEITLIYNNNDYTVKLPQGADRMTICSEIKRQTGVKGAFYLFDGGKFYLHSSSLTLSNINKVLAGKLEVRGGDWMNKGGDSVWYYYSQTLRPDVKQQLEKRQFVPSDQPP